MLEVKNLSFKVSEDGHERYIVDDISFTVGEGETVVVTGPNGSGKSTLARVLMGLEKADRGTILLDGVDITDFSIDERAKAGIGYAFQQPPRFKGMTVDRLMNLAAGRELSIHECCDYLSRVGMCSHEYVKREVDATLSGGEMKRIEIATVLAGSHRLRIFDEPEAGIDLWSFSMLVGEFEQDIKDEKKTQIIISHQERIMAIADRIMVIDGGRISAFGPREEILPKLAGGPLGGCSCMKGGSGHGKN